MTGKFIVLEGIDGSGLSTQASLLVEYLSESLHTQVFLTKEPTDGPAGAQIRLKLRERLVIDEATLALLFAADRLDHLNTDVLPRLSNGYHVVSDRYYLSSLAYQSLDLDQVWLRSINERSRRPDLTLFLDVPVEVCMARLRAHRWRLELYEKEDKLVRIRANYLWLIPELRKEGEDIVVVDGSDGNRERSIDEVHLDIRAAVARVID